MTDTPVDLAEMSDAELAAYSAYWLQLVNREPQTLVQHMLREAAYDTLRYVRREAKRRARMVVKAERK